jgi:Arc/MetJ family transcription regulator
LAVHFSRTYDYSRRAYTTGGKPACGLRGSDVADYRIIDAHSPDEAANMVITDGLRAAVAVAKRAGIPNARTHVEDAFRRWTERGAVSAGAKIIEAQGFDTTPANNAEIDWRPVFAAEAEFVLRRIAELRRDRRTREARALRELLPDRLEWRWWRGTLTERDRRRVATAEANAAAFDAAIRAGEIPDPKNTDLGDMVMACLEADMRRAAARTEGADM